ncbi:P1 family peptidase [Kordiimonas lacus]|uniref:L-aminopeptidase/D-esterase n=1 Tax=Kordiimonas lacus TaxID=637679 RepID=A0A1G7FD56_9PROT|nr:P1 family peptidase [Kordiimonas lacus]SDE73873.1 L-aminopeptidase/D-esterase [Kordiimonas lacus]
MAGTPKQREKQVSHALKALLLSTVLCLPAFAAPVDGQSGLEPVLNAGDNKMTFDWPILKVGTGEYVEGPTGVTVFHFNRKVNVAIDVRGGGPGTVNAPYMNLGYDMAELDTIVFAGGSWYGLEATTAVATALKDDGIRDGDAFSLEPNIAMSVGSIIFDFGSRRLNEIYPDKKLAQAAYRAAKTGSFPLGAQGAGRFAKSGGIFGCNAFSGQGGAFRQVGDVKIAAFVVANPYGAITDRDGNLAACYEGESWPGGAKIADLMADFPKSRDNDWEGKEASGASAKNTTISLIVTNQKMTPAELKRLAVQVHTSMARGIQPFATLFDGDVLYAVSTAELEEPAFWGPDLGLLASEVMWDALLASVPAQPEITTPDLGLTPSGEQLAGYAGTYQFSRFASLKVHADGGKLFARANGKRKVYGITHDADTELLPMSDGAFTAPGRYPLTFRFEGDGTLVINPGHWQQTGTRKEQ